MIIAARYNGPPGSGNGGYTAGLLASHVSGGADGVEVTLRRPPPLETELTLRTDGVPTIGDIPLTVGVLRAYDGDDLVAEATVNVVGDDETVPAVSYDEAVAASASYPGFVSHPFVTCFVCGPARSLVTAADRNTVDVVLDLADLRFCDSAGLAVFVKTHNDLEASGRRLVVARPAPEVARILDLSGLSQVIPTTDDLAEACATATQR